MAHSVVIVNGLPGSGKSTLATPLARALPATLLAKDSLKEALAAVTDRRLHGGLGAIAMTTAWQLARSVDGIAVVDSWWFRPRDLEFARAGIQEAGAKKVVEVWCEVPIEVAQARYARRVRDELHNDDRDMSREWAAWRKHGRPLALSPVESVDTTTRVDIAGLGDKIDKLLRGHVV